MDEFTELLISLGFLDVTGRFEKVEKKFRRVPIVPPEGRINASLNNGILCAVNKDGRTFIAPIKVVPPPENPKAKKFWEIYDNNVDKGNRVHVPFSNDGGVFKKEMWPYIT